jgi:multidrug resistance efflux pump
MNKIVASDSLNAQDILESIYALRDFQGSKEELLEAFIRSASQLVKSPIGVYFTQEGEQWVVKSSYGFGGEDRAALEQSIENALILTPRVMKNKFAYDRVGFEWLEFSNQVAIGIKVEDRNSAFIYLIIEQLNAQQLSEMVVRLLMIADIPYTFEKSLQVKVSMVDTTQPKIDTLSILSKVIYQEKFILASMNLVNELASKFNCTQVSLGWLEGDHIKTVAMSHVEKFDRQTEALYEIEALFDEAASQNMEINHPSNQEDTIVYAHQKYLHNRGATQLLSLPLRIDKMVVGVVLCEKQEGSLSQEEVVALRLIANYITPWLKTRHRYDRWFGSRLAYSAKETFSEFLGVRHTLLKALGVVFSLLFIYGVLGSWNYKVEATSTLETDNVAFLSAPFNGFVKEVKVHSGDKVESNATLLLFDQEEFYLKKAEILADMHKYSRESQKARAAGALADMRVALAKYEQSKASLKRVEYYLSKSKLKAPFGGVVIQGDKEELLGSPVSKGDLLFKVAKPTDMYLKFKVQESEIDELQVAQKGEFALLSSPEDKYAFEIEKIIPMASVDSSEGNIFVVKAKIVDGQLGWWRPGMSGVAKVDVGERNILWILTHKLSDFLRIYFWI